MAENTNIEWCDSTFNPFIGCTKVSPGCDNCYAENLMDTRMGKVVWGPKGERVRTGTASWRKPLTWNANHEAFFAEHGRRQRVFCASLADVFDNAVPAEWRANLFTLIRSTPNLDWLLLTKRIGNVKPMLADIAHGSDPDLSLLDMMPLPNVWLGATVVNQEEADRDIPKLMNVPARVHFLSMEPLLESVDLKLMQYEDSDHRQPDGKIIANTRRRIIKWVIVGGESGPGARPMHPDWARSLRDQCQAAGVPFLFKQWGDWLPGQNEAHPSDGRKVAHHQDGRWGATDTKITSSNYVAWDEDGAMHHGNLINKPISFRADAWAERVGKKAAGRLLDGRTWDEFPPA